MKKQILNSNSIPSPYPIVIGEGGSRSETEGVKSDGVVNPFSHFVTASPIMGKQRILAALAIIGGLIVSTPALAHFGIGHEHGFSHGIEHFFSGLDHIAFAIGAGVLSAIFAGKRALTFGFAALSLIVFAIIHKIGLFDGQGVSGFETGQMMAAGMVLFAAYAIARPLFGKLKLGRIGNER